MNRLRWLALVVVLAGAVVGVRSLGSDYELTFVMPTADNTFVGARVTIKGSTVGKVTGVGTRDGRALVTIKIDDEHAPLKAGTTARIGWESLIGARIVDLTPGPDSNPSLRSGRLVLGSAVEAVELDDLLAALDEPTRAKLQKLVGQLDQVMKNGGAADFNSTLATAGPMVEAMGQVTKAIGSDGPAIRELVDELHRVTSTLAERHAHVSNSVSALNSVTSRVATQQEALSATLAKLPDTVETARSTLAAVPGPAAKARTLLSDLRPTTDRLPSVAANLSPLLRDLRPAAAELRPTLRAAAELLTYTPELLSTAHGTVPDATTTVKELEPVVTFLRPYTPELTGWLTNWTSIFGSQSAGGNYARALITFGGSSFNNNPGAFLPGQRQDPRPAPGSIISQPWDANGDGLR
jgi:phospholipid/cholesterol/gamma-HCH transport system substrate-binding protein